MNSIAIITPYRYWWEKLSAYIVADIYKRAESIVPIIEKSTYCVKLKNDTQIRWIRPAYFEMDLRGLRLDNAIIAECRLAEEQFKFLQASFIYSYS